MNRKILIVDDERALTQLLCAHLTNEGYLVYTATQIGVPRKILSWLAR